jgi:hypothetical protein
LPRYARGETGREIVPLLLDALDSEEWFLRRAADLALRDVLNRKVGDQDWWTPPGEQARMKREWNTIWGEILGR